MVGRGDVCEGRRSGERQQQYYYNTTTTTTTTLYHVVPRRSPRDAGHAGIDLRAVSPVDASSRLARLVAGGRRPALYRGSPRGTRVVDALRGSDGRLFPVRADATQDVVRGDDGRAVGITPLGLSSRNAHRPATPIGPAAVGVDRTVDGRNVGLFLVGIVSHLAQCPDSRHDAGRSDGGGRRGADLTGCVALVDLSSTTTTTIGSCSDIMLVAGLDSASVYTAIPRRPVQCPANALGQIADPIGRSDGGPRQQSQTTRSEMGGPAQVIGELRISGRTILGRGGQIVGPVHAVGTRGVYHGPVQRHGSVLHLHAHE